MIYLLEYRDKTASVCMIRGRYVDVPKVSSTTSRDSTPVRRGPGPGVGHTTTVSLHTNSNEQSSSHTNREVGKPITFSHKNIEETVGDAHNMLKSNRAHKQLSTKKTYLEIGLWNCNSMNPKKHEYAKNFMKSSNFRVLCLTELTSENCLLANFLFHDPEYSVISSDNTRVGIMVPSAIKSKVKIVDNWNLEQIRRKIKGKDRKSDIICQMTTFKIDNSIFQFHVCVVYLAPDFNSESREAVFDKMLELSIVYKNLTTCTDFCKSLTQ